jgi:hypothetical protein
MSEHTPGPWIVDREFNVIQSQSRRSVATTGGHSNSSDVEGVHVENVANARLIAAAPELLEACKRAVAILSACPPTVRQIIEGGDEAIGAAGLNPWCINEGLATGDEPHDVTWRLYEAIAKAMAGTPESKVGASDTTGKGE